MTARRREPPVSSDHRGVGQARCSFTVYRLRLVSTGLVFFVFFRVTHPSFGVPGASLARVAAARLSRPRPPSGDAHRVWGVAVTECRVFEIRVARRVPSASERAPWVPSAYVPSVVTPFIVPLGLPIQKPFILALPPVSAAPPASPRGAPGCPRRWRSSRNPSRSASPVRPPRPPETSRSSTSPT